MTKQTTETMCHKQISQILRQTIKTTYTDDHLQYTILQSHYQ